MGAANVNSGNSLVHAVRTRVSGDRLGLGADCVLEVGGSSNPKRIARKNQERRGRPRARESERVASALALTPPIDSWQ
jgi:hypothetical protein